MFSARSLKALYSEHTDSKDSASRPFYVPYDYNKGRRYDIFLPHPPVLPDRYLGDSARLGWVKRNLSSWSWHACNLALNDALLGGQSPESAEDLSNERKAAMSHAVRYIRAHGAWYNGRPDEIELHGPWVASLRAILSQTPKPHMPGSEFIRKNLPS